VNALGHLTSVHRVLSKTLFILALLLLLGHLVVYVNYAIGLMRFPFDYDQGEGFELVDTIMFSEGEWPYRDNEVYPYYASNYPPLFHVLLVPLVWLFGKAYWYGRLVGFLGTLVTATAIGIMVYRAERHRGVAVLSGLAFLASNYVYHIGPLFRQHMTMVMFETLAVAVVASAVGFDAKRRKTRMLVVGLLLLLAAGYTKQHAVATCAAVFVFLFIRNPRLGIRWGAVFAIVAGGIFLWINAATGGAWWTNIIAANVNDYYPSQFAGLFWQWFRLHGALIIPAATLAVYELYFARLSLYSVWWGFAVGSTVLSGKWGAGDSYFATTIAATCVLSGIAAARTLRGGWFFPENAVARRFSWLRQRYDDHRIEASALLPLFVAVLYVWYGFSVIKLPTEGRLFGWLSDVAGLESSYGERYAFYDSAGWTQGYAAIGHVPTQEDIDHGWEIVGLVRSSDLPVMSEEAAFSLKAGKDVVTNPTQLKNLFENDLYDPTNLVADIQAHRFGLIIFRAQFYPPPVLAAVYEAYYPSETIPMNGFDYEIWRPGPPQEEREALLGIAGALDVGEERSLMVSMAVDEAARWVAHALTRLDGEQRGNFSPLDDTVSCAGGTFWQAGRRLEVTVCPAGTQATVHVALRDGEQGG